MTDMIALGDAERALVERARTFAAEHVAPLAATWERERRIGRESLREAGRRGLIGLDAPRDHGGLGLRFSAKVAVLQAIGAADFGFAFSLVNAGNLADQLLREAPAPLSAKWAPQLLAGEVVGGFGLTEPGMGSDFSRIATTAERVDGAWRLNGAKAWITNASEGQVFLIYAQTQPGARGRGIAGFVVEADRPGFAREPAFALAGGHAIGAGGFRLDDYMAPEGALLRPAGEAFRTALASLNRARTYVAALCCAALRASLEAAIAYGRERQAFERPLVEHQGLAWSLAEVATELAAADALVARACTAIDEGRDATLEAAQAKLFAPRTAERGIAACIQAMGAEGLREEHALGRHLAAARLAQFTDGSNEMQRDRIAALVVRGG
ncbi:acyl-CoA dehydrogenase family protein [Zavarzinia sp. CC-PAN008]|uniref:acyl-CoA dehydrogenase family protein n=1 Tax=Zavarzinia sp. CC-PAN008 TaxID=3243332 RepID=UPI003F744570